MPIYALLRWRQKYVMAEAASGAIILLHDAEDVLSCPSTQWTYLATTIDGLRAEGYEFGVARLRHGQPNTGSG